MPDKLVDTGLHRFFQTDTPHAVVVQFAGIFFVQIHDFIITLLVTAD